MSEMKCPFCQQELLLSSYRDDDTAHQMWSCLSCQLSAYRKIWDALIRTRKALEIAVDALKEIKYVGSWAYVGGLASEFTEPEIAQQALKQITALEQKDK